MAQASDLKEGPNSQGSGLRQEPERGSVANRVELNIVFSAGEDGKRAEGLFPQSIPFPPQGMSPLMLCPLLCMSCPEQT